MSNLGIKEIKIPSNIKLEINNKLLSIKSNFGELNYEINEDFILELTKKNSIKFYPKEKKKIINCNWGNKYNLLKNIINKLYKKK